MLAPSDDIIEIVARGDRRAGHQQQDLLERVNNAPRLTLVLEMRKVPQKQGQTRTRNLLLEDRVHDGRSHANQSADGITPRRQLKIAPRRPLT